MRQHRVKRDIFSKKETTHVERWLFSDPSLAYRYFSVNMGLSSSSGFVPLDKLLFSGSQRWEGHGNKLGTWISENPNKGQKPNHELQLQSIRLWPQQHGCSLCLHSQAPFTACLKSDLQSGKEWRTWSHPCCHDCGGRWLPSGLLGQDSARAPRSDALGQALVSSPPHIPIPKAFRGEKALLKVHFQGKIVPSSFLHNQLQSISSSALQQRKVLGICFLMCSWNSVYVTERGESLLSQSSNYYVPGLPDNSISSPYLNFNISCLRLLHFIWSTSQC